MFSSTMHRFSLCLCIPALAPSLPANASIQSSAETDTLPSVEGSFAAADGARLFYRLLGRGEDTVVVIHGGPGTSMREAFDLDGLAKQGHALLLYDQRGAGNSELVSAPSRLTLASHVSDLEALRRHFRFSRLQLIGLSWGSAIALHYAIAYPGSTDRLVFLSPMPPTGRFFVQRFARLDSLRTRETRARLRSIDSLWSVADDSSLAELCRENGRVSSSVYQKSGTEPRGDPCEYPPPVLRHRRLARIAALTALGAEYDFTAALRRLNRPTLVVEGAQSRMPLEATRYWAGHAENARLLLVEGAGHRTWIDQPARLLSAIQIFLSGEWPRGAERIRLQ